MSNKKGFIYIETIITVVVLMTTLVFLYSSYSNVVTAERIRLYHDDIAYVYKTKHIRDVVVDTLDEAKFETAINMKLDGIGPNSSYLYIFNVESDIFKNNTFISRVRELYHIYRLVYVRIEDIPTIKECINKDKSAVKCQNTIALVESYGYSYLKDYLLDFNFFSKPSSAKR